MEDTMRELIRREQAYAVIGAAMKLEGSLDAEHNGCGNVLLLQWMKETGFRAGLHGWKRMAL
jgi:hypothetical protein